MSHLRVHLKKDNTWKEDTKAAAASGSANAKASQKVSGGIL